MSSYVLQLVIRTNNDSYWGQTCPMLLKEPHGSARCRLEHERPLALGYYQYPLRTQACQLRELAARVSERVNRRPSELHDIPDGRRSDCGTPDTVHLRGGDGRTVCHRRGRSVMTIHRTLVTCRTCLRRSAGEEEEEEDMTCRYCGRYDCEEECRDPDYPY